jgi:hypothetical protein
MNRKQIQKSVIFVVLCTMLAMPVLETANAATIPTLTIAPTSSSKVITVIGNGFDANASVHLALVNETTGVVVYNFTETIQTNMIGVFTSDVTLPSAIYGTYYVYARTTTVSATKEYSLSIATNPKISASPANSNIIKVTGNGFYPNDIVVFTLTKDVFISVYNFTDYGVTDALGNFTTTLIIPTSISGNYTLTAQTKTGLTANTPAVVPDLTGPKGDTGETGAKGAKGTAGPVGKDADNTILYIAVIISIIAAVIAVLALIKNRETYED